MTYRIGGINSALAFKAPCRVAALTNITLSGFQTIDDVTLAEGDENLRVLVAGQTNETENGIYNADGGDWARAKDFDGNTDFVEGTRVYVHSGTDGVGVYQVTTSDPIVLGTDDITFSREVLNLGPEPNSLTKAIDVFQTESSTDYGSPESADPPVGYTFNRIRIDDNLGGSSHSDYQNFGLSVQHTLTGNQVDGPRTAVFGLMDVEATLAATSVLNFNCAVGGLTIIRAAQNGTGFAEGVYGAVIATSAASSMDTIAGAEFAVGNAGASLANKVDLLLTSMGAADTVRADNVDAKIAISALAGSVKRNQGILFSEMSGAYPVDIHLIASSSASVQCAIDLSAVTCSSDFIRAQSGFRVSGAGSPIIPNNVALRWFGSTGNELSPITMLSNNALFINGQNNIITNASIIPLTTAGADNIGQAANPYGNVVLSSGKALSFGTSNTTFTLTHNSSVLMTASGGVTAGGPVTASSAIRAISATSAPAGGSSAQGFIMGSSAMGVYFGSGAPTLQASPGSLYLRTDGGSSLSRAYIASSTAVWVGLLTTA